MSARGRDPQAARPRGTRGLGQRLALGAALLSYLGAVVSGAALGLSIGELGGNHPVTASLGACVVFFVGAGIVLHVIARTDLPDLRFRRDR